MLRRIERHIRTRLAAGLLILLPVVVTYLVLRLLVGFVDGLLDPFFNQLQARGVLAGRIPGLGFITALLLVYLAGVVGATVLGRQLVNLGHRSMERIPLIRIIYRTAKEATNVFANSHAERYSRAVLVEFPRPGVQSLGLVTGRYRGADGVEQLTVYIPTVPNPTSGFLVIVREDEVHETPFTVEEAMRIVLSGGILTEEIQHAAVSRPQQPAKP
ncbi:MAG: DUF502 domain-containing protein [Chloroflexi bacterium]|nr:DUF502 domain-containing protein [Chloroflexota bacterium]